MGEGLDGGVDSEMLDGMVGVWSGLGGGNPQRRCCRGDWKIKQETLTTSQRRRKRIDPVENHKSYNPSLVSHLLRYPPSIGHATRPPSTGSQQNED